MHTELGPVRPLFNMAEKLPKGKKYERLIAGSKNGGMMIDVTKEGLEINGYYTLSEDRKYANLRQPIVIPWRELDRLKKRIENPRNKKSVLDRIEENVDQKYLDTLPIVTINNKKYYIDPDRKERRSVAKPTEVWRWA